MTPGWLVVGSGMILEWAGVQIIAPVLFSTTPFPVIDIRA